MGSLRWRGIPGATGCVWKQCKTHLAPNFALTTPLDGFGDSPQTCCLLVSLLSRLGWFSFRRTRVQATITAR